MRAFLLIERHSIRWFNGGPAEKPEIKGVMCLVLKESLREVAECIGGEYDRIPFDDALRPIIRLPKKLFSPCSEDSHVLHYEKGPINLYLGEKDAGTHLFIVEVPTLEHSLAAI